eukprot:767576-Hanusia_phi.AAC.1
MAETKVHLFANDSLLGRLSFLLAVLSLFSLLLPLLPLLLLRSSRRPTRTGVCPSLGISVKRSSLRTPLFPPLLPLPSPLTSLPLPPLLFHSSHVGAADRVVGCWGAAGVAPQLPQVSTRIHFPSDSYRRMCPLLVPQMLMAAIFTEDGTGAGGVEVGRQQGEAVGRRQEDLLMFEAEVVRISRPVLFWAGNFSEEEEDKLASLAPVSDDGSFSVLYQGTIPYTSPTSSSPPLCLRPRPRPRPRPLRSLPLRPLPSRPPLVMLFFLCLLTLYLSTDRMDSSSSSSSLPPAGGWIVRRS